MTFTIHRGANEIGGSCVEICTDTTRLVLEIGMQLVNPSFQLFNIHIMKLLERVLELVKIKTIWRKNGI